MRTTQTVKQPFTSIALALLITTIPFTSLLAERSRKPKVQNATIQLTEKGYEPDILKLSNGVPATENLSGLRVGDVMARDCPRVDGRFNLQTFVDEYLLRTGRRCFLVEEQHHRNHHRARS